MVKAASTKSGVMGGTAGGAGGNGSATEKPVKRRVEVTIMGMPLAVRTEREDAWIHGLANQVSRRLDELKRAAPRANPTQLAVLLALNLAEELAVERDKVQTGAGLADDAREVAEAALARVQAALLAVDTTITELGAGFGPPGDFDDDHANDEDSSAGRRRPRTVQAEA